MDDDAAAATVDAAWDNGIRLFDTAPHYGLGLSERRLGAALADRPRDQVTVVTKVGRRLEPDPGGADRPDPGGFLVPADQRRVWDFSAEGVRRTLESSLDRLGLDRLDVVLLHDPEGHERAAADEAYPALRALRDEGVIGAIGAGSTQTGVLTRLATRADLDVIMVAGRYTLLEQPALDDLLPVATSRGVRVLAAGVFNSGLLAEDRPRDDLPYEYAPAPAPLVRRASALAAVCARHGTTLPAAALAFAAAHPAVSDVVVGAHGPAQVTRNVTLAATPPPVDLWADLKEQGLLRADAPTPS